MSEVLSKQLIHSSAIIHPSAQIGDNVTIGPWVRIGKSVVIGDNTTIESGAIIDKYTKIGQNNKIYPYAAIGIDPQDKSYNGRDICTLEIGDNNILREYITISRGTAHGGKKTIIGSNNLVMAYVHIGHDCIVGNNNIFANNAALAGHVTIANHVTMSGYSGMHQFCSVGDYVFLGMRAVASQDIAPYMLVAGAEPTVRGVNTVGLKRSGFDDQVIKILRSAYKSIYRQGQMLKKSCQDLELEYGHVPQIQTLLNFIKNSKRGLQR